MNTKMIRTAGALALTALLALGPAASAQQQTVLSGVTGGLNWTVYGPGQRATPGNQAAALQVSAPAQATVTGTKYDNQTVALTFRVNAPLMAVYAYHDTQLRTQGFVRTSQSISGNNAQAIYTRADAQVKLTVLRQGNTTYRATLDLSGMQINVPRGAGVTATVPAPANPAPATATPASAAPAAVAATPSPATQPPVSPTPISPTPATPNPASPTPAIPARPASSMAAVVTTFTAQQNASAGRDALVRAQDLASVAYLLYGPTELGSLSNDPSTVSFSLPVGTSLTETVLASGGDLTARITGSRLNLAQLMDFYDRQFKAQGFALINPTGAGLSNTLTHVYQRGTGSRVAFSVTQDGSTDRLFWDFQRP
ncbi:hypothetical protein [Deinococcus arenicola]|uniref:AMIN domain-containing protein n=1 Tax=Deinococcus arenicola TaxID=2994950 RepID=A0ABU4DTJ2_9DEIO|nr:hypothetical protein [Deinococcus sp. ZS9-10]MDV6375756.1 hypothetical protein [Deinococcus sp. ZS9-10]